MFLIDIKPYGIDQKVSYFKQGLAAGLLLLAMMASGHARAVQLEIYLTPLANLAMF
jgi:hypothetical protein